jgi:transcriptional regulator with XRE-family HTH domain
MKTKLITARKNKRFSREDIATCLKISPTQYRRKEFGEVRIFDDEWDKIAKLLEIPIEDIYEENENVPQNIENLENISSSYIGNHNLFCNVPEFILQDLHDVIIELREENKRLKAERMQPNGKIGGGF